MIVLSTIGTSMWPTIREGDTLLVEENNSPSINIGDTLLYKIGEKFFVHRLLWKFQDFFLIKADTHFFFERINKEQIKGKIKAVVRNGQIINLTAPLHKILSFLLAICLLPISFLYNIMCSRNLQIAPFLRRLKPAATEESC